MKTKCFAVLVTVWWYPCSAAADSVLEAEPPDSEAASETPDPELLKELAAASEADAAALSELKGADASAAEDRDNEDPLNELPAAVQGVVGNEANPSISIILDTAFAYFTEENRYRQGGHAPTTNGPAIQGAELAASASVDPYFRMDMAFGLYHLHLEEIYATTTALPFNLQVRAGQFNRISAATTPRTCTRGGLSSSPLPMNFSSAPRG